MSDTITAAEYRRLMDQPEAGSLPDTLSIESGQVHTLETGWFDAGMPTQRKQKYGAVRTTVDGIVFASKAEASRYIDLKRLQEAGEIGGLELQPRFPLVVNGVKVCTYIADFRYYDHKSKKIITEDVKGIKTSMYRVKVKLLKALHGIEIRETS